VVALTGTTGIIIAIAIAITAIAIAIIPTQPPIFTITIFTITIWHTWHVAHLAHLLGPAGRFLVPGHHKKHNVNK